MSEGMAERNFPAGDDADAAYQGLFTRRRLFPCRNASSPYNAHHPPSTARHTPLMKPAASDARNTTGPAISAMVPRRPMGVPRLISSLRPTAAWRSSPPAMLLVVQPGLIALTRMLYRPHSTQSCR